MSSDAGTGTGKFWWRVIVIALALCQGAVALGQRGGVSSDLEMASLLDGIEANTAKQERLEREAGDLSARKDQTRSALRGQVRALYRITRSGLAPVAGGFDAVLRHVARLRRLQRLVQREAQQLNAIETRAQSLRVDRAQVAQALEQARARLGSLQDNPPTELPSFAAGETSFHGGADTGGESYGLRLVDPGPEAGFDAQRGHLSSPVTGEVRIVSARRNESDGPGLEFQAPPGTPVAAAAAGRVAFSDRYGSYGRLVILDHGEGYYTVYGGLGAVEVRVGDDLSQHARIGSIGSDSSPPALFFEVRKGTRTVEPRGWLGL